MSAVPSNADVKKASLKAFTHAMGMSAFVELGRRPGPVRTTDRNQQGKLFALYPSA